RSGERRVQVGGLRCLGDQATVHVQQHGLRAGGANINTQRVARHAVCTVLVLATSQRRTAPEGTERVRTRGIPLRCGAANAVCAAVGIFTSMAFKVEHRCYKNTPCVLQTCYLRANAGTNCESITAVARMSG